MIIDLQKKEEHDLFKHEKCAKCNEKFILNRYMVHDGLFYFHLTCFKTYLERKKRDYEILIEDGENKMNELNDYSRDMICETLLKEKYG